MASPCYLSPGGKHILPGLPRVRAARLLERAPVRRGAGAVQVTLVSEAVVEAH
jgi:hypothetical protein